MCVNEWTTEWSLRMTLDHSGLETELRWIMGRNIQSRSENEELGASRVVWSFLMVLTSVGATS